MVSFGHLSLGIFQNWEHLGLDRQCSPGKFLLTVPHSSNSYSLHCLVCLLLPSPHLSILCSLPNRIIRRTLPRTKIFSWVTIFSGIFLGSDCLHNRTQIRMMSRRNREKARVGCNQLAWSDQVSVIHKDLWSVKSIVTWRVCVKSPLRLGNSTDWRTPGDIKS